jgi:hypothetical protein
MTEISILSSRGGPLATVIYEDPTYLAVVAKIMSTLRPALTEEMDLVMLEVQRMARAEADWNPDGTEVTTSIGRKYEVTGAARHGIAGYAVGAMRQPFEDFSYTDAVTSSNANKVHYSDPSISEPPPEDPFLIQGVLTMYDNTAAYLQRHERGEYNGSGGGVSPASPLAKDGQQVTTRVLQQHAGEISTMLEAGAATAFEALGKG